ncbi:hypothetical protein AB2B41_20690 [Marimonas sp. MJW-29]|uniref:DUF4239 domain-containing protein n=1 Tax=Sulfitobacter sediminis TaxID=3234186 RepID=A0ABV3RSQ6_9RHOB
MNPHILASLAVLVGTPLLTIASYITARRVLAPAVSTDTSEMAASIAFRIAAFHGLMISLVFAGVVQTFQDVRGQLIVEATALSEIFADLEFFEGEAGTSVRDTLKQYVATVIAEEWPGLANGTAPADQAWRIHREMRKSILNLPVNTTTQSQIKRALDERVREVSSARHARWHMRSLSLPLVFWIAAFGGLVFVSISFFVYQPSGVNLLLLTLYGSYTGIALAVIFALSKPFAPPASMSPLALQDLILLQEHAAP